MIRSTGVRLLGGTTGPAQGDDPIDTFRQHDRQLRRQYPLPHFLAPWGWCFARNNLLDAAPAVLDGIEDQQTVFLLRDLYFCGMIFSASGDFPLRNGDRLQASLHVTYASNTEHPYEIELHLRKGKARNSAHQFDIERAVATAREAIDVINAWMNQVSNELVECYDPANERIDAWFPPGNQAVRATPLDGHR
ncbi:TPA: hypothetical protein UMB92_002355 [Stenotrophomonas maltophilia]|nr:hypothetical protein [Stenotrophomonas maltophilia]